MKKHDQQQHGHQQQFFSSNNKVLLAIQNVIGYTMSQFKARDKLS